MIDGDVEARARVEAARAAATAPSAGAAEAAPARAASAETARAAAEAAGTEAPAAPAEAAASAKAARAWRRGSAAARVALAFDDDVALTLIAAGGSRAIGRARAGRGAPKIGGRGRARPSGGEGKPLAGGAKPLGGGGGMSPLLGADACSGACGPATPGGTAPPAPGGANGRRKRGLKAGRLGWRSTLVKVKPQRSCCSSCRAKLTGRVSTAVRSPSSSRGEALGKGIFEGGTDAGESCRRCRARGCSRSWRSASGRPW